MGTFLPAQAYPSQHFGFENVKSLNLQDPLFG